MIPTGATKLTRNAGAPLWSRYTARMFPALSSGVTPPRTLPMATTEAGDQAVACCISACVRGESVEALAATAHGARVTVSNKA